MAKKSTKELEQQRTIAFMKSYTRGRNQYANIDGSASILDWDRSRLDTIARTRGFRTKEGVDYAVANELGITMRSATRIINNGKMTWGQCILIGAMFEMTPKEFCDIFMYDYFKETPTGDFRAQISEEDKKRILFRRQREEKKRSK